MCSATIKMFYESRYESVFSASVISVDKPEGAGVEALDVVLDRTLFYPEGGGQVCDTGKIAGFDVESVFEKEDDSGAASIYHRIVANNGAALKKGDSVKCEVDFKRRFQNMQDHTGQHVLSEAFIRTAGLNTVSMHMGAEYMTIDLAVENPPKNFKLEKNVIEAAEDMANETVFRDLEVKTFFISKAELSMYSLRKTPELKDENVRLVDIFKYDTSLCCGTHVSRTGEIGMIKVIGQEKVNQGVRIKFVCGARALADYRIKNTILSEIAESLSVKNTELKKAFEKMTDENKALSKAKADLFEKYYSRLSEDLCAKMPIQSHTSEAPGKALPSDGVIGDLTAGKGIERSVYFDQADGLSYQDIVRVGQIFSKAPGKFAFALAKIEQQPDGAKTFRFVIGRTASHPVDMKALFAEISAAYTIKGGGSPQVVQGGNIPAGKLEEFKAFIVGKLGIDG